VSDVPRTPEGYPFLHRERVSRVHGKGVRGPKIRDCKTFPRKPASWYPSHPPAGSHGMKRDRRLVKSPGENEGTVLVGGTFLRDAPGKEWDAWSPEDIVSFPSNYINSFSFSNVLNYDLNYQMNLLLLMGRKDIPYAPGIRRKSSWIPGGVLDREASWNPWKGDGTCCGSLPGRNPGPPMRGYGHIHLFLPAGETPEHIRGISPGARE
jgi:hypothetical protein